MTLASSSPDSEGGFPGIGSEFWSERDECKRRERNLSTRVPIGFWREREEEDDGGSGESKERNENGLLGFVEKREE